MLLHYPALVLLGVMDALWELCDSHHVCMWFEKLTVNLGKKEVYEDIL